jgi:hypothetical protein
MLIAPMGQVLTTLGLHYVEKYWLLIGAANVGVLGELLETEVETGRASPKLQWVHLGRAIGGETDTRGGNSALDQDKSIDYASCRFGMSISNRVKRKDCCRWTRMVGFSCHKRVETLKSDLEKWPQLSWTRQAFPVNDLPDLRRPLI